LFLGGKCNLDFIHSDSVSRAFIGGGGGGIFPGGAA